MGAVSESTGLWQGRTTPLATSLYWPRCSQLGQVLSRFGRKGPQQATGWVVKGRSVISAGGLVCGKEQGGICTYRGEVGA